MHQVSYQPLLTVHGCTFENVASFHEDGTVFYDVSHSSITNITSTVIRDSDGFFYYSAHYVPSEFLIEQRSGAMAFVLLPCLSDCALKVGPELRWSHRY